MSRSIMESWPSAWRSVVLAIGAWIVAALPMPSVAIDLADQPMFGTSSPPGNLLLALSVEWPTATSAAYPSTSPYSTGTTYVGYFNPAKCYRYNYQAQAKNSYFEPASDAVGNACTTTAATPLWSGNYMNWASTQTLDAFRWVLTGGTRLVDTTTTTILQKTLQKHSSSGDSNFFPDRTIVESTSAGAKATPFNWGLLISRGYNLGATLLFTTTQADSCSHTTTAVPHEVNFGCSFAGTNVNCRYPGGFPTPGNPATCQTAATATAPSLSCTATVNGSNQIIYACTSGPGAIPTCTASSPTVSFSGPNSQPGKCSAASSGTVDYTNQSSAAGTASPGTSYRVYVQVKVCDPAAGLESNCTRYGSNYKPEGLIQKYASKLRFSVFSYLNDSSLSRDGGVMRARMKFVGPTIPQPGVDASGNPKTSVNYNAEWDSATGVAILNPDPKDVQATNGINSYATKVLTSGVINYVNKFGTVNDLDYKSIDPVSELYYASLRYYRNLGNVPEYSSMGGATVGVISQYIDGFPLISNWNEDPIIYSCQKNFILGIGDVNTHADANLPGSDSNFRTAEPAMPASVASDKDTDVAKSTNMVGTLEGSANLATQHPGQGSDNSYFIAGLAYAAHTTDIRPDMPGMQTVDTFWLDVLEKQIYYAKNQYWLAAKYGGFTIPPGFDPFGAGNSSTTLPITSWHNTADSIAITNGTGSDLRPDNYFGAYLADKMRDALTAAFVKIDGSATTLLTSTATSSASPDIATVGSASYSATYDPTDWSGVVQGSTLTFGSGNSPTVTLQWDAAKQLDATSLLPTSRVIATCCTNSATNPGLPFRAASLAAATFNSPNGYASFGQVPGAGTTQSAAAYVDYLRGDHGQEVINGGVYRNRNHRLGDIVNAHLNAVGPPSQPYFDFSNPGYGKFRRSQMNRKTVVYAAANDGMLHAFDGSVPGGGAELFAYVPGSAYEGSAGAVATGLASLGNTNFIHHYLVDATPNTYDVDFGRTRQAITSAVDWHTVLIAGVGKGGKGYYAIDVTDPASWTSEAAVAGKVLWEFSDSRMGFTFGDADVVRTKKYGWVVIVTSGYGNADGKGYFFFLDPRTGALLETLATPDGTIALPLDMGQQTAFLPDAGDSLADAVYAGDMRGNVWRVDLTPASGNYDAPVKIAIAADAAGTRQPISTRLLVDAAAKSKKRYVFVGTGRLLGESDLGSTGRQSFYAFIDGTSGVGEFRPAPLTAATRSDLSVVADLSVGLVNAASISALGWYFDLGSSTSGTAERVTLVPASSGGIVYGAINQPVGVQCSASGTSRVFALGFDNAKSVLTDSSGILVSSLPIGSNVVDLAVKTVGGVKRLIVGNDGGSAGPVIRVIDPSAKTPASLTRLNWREVPTAD